MNRKTGPGSLEFGLREDVQIFMHPPNEVPHAFEAREIKQTVLWGSKKEIIVKLDEIIDPAKETTCQTPAGEHANRYSGSQTDFFFSFNTLSVWHSKYAG